MVGFWFVLSLDFTHNQPSENLAYWKQARNGDTKVLLSGCEFTSGYESDYLLVKLINS